MRVAPHSAGVQARKRDGQVASSGDMVGYARMPTETGKSLLVVVDLNRCQAYAQCCFLAPEVFELHGREALWYDLAPDPVQRDRVRAAAAACPVQAIRVAWSHATSRRNGARPNA